MIPVIRTAQPDKINADTIDISRIRREAGRILRRSVTYNKIRFRNEGDDIMVLSVNWPMMIRAVRESSYGRRAHV